MLKSTPQFYNDHQRFIHDFLLGGGGGGGGRNYRVSFFRDSRKSYYLVSEGPFPQEFLSFRGEI